jgi:formiminotetrahydrofolate cyclodeaminase
MGVELKSRKLSQVSMNLTDFEATSMATVFTAVANEAAAQGVEIAGSEIVGLVPRRALEDAAVQYLRIGNFRPESIVENRLEQILEQKVGETEGAETPLRKLVDKFVNAVAAPAPIPAGGSAAALAGALGAALGEMVCGVSLERKSLAAHHASLAAAQTRLTGLRARLLANIDRDAESYASLMAALKLPRTSDEEHAVRNRAVEEASYRASKVPLETAELAAAVAREVASLTEITITQTQSDLGVAASLAEAARRGGIHTVCANLAGVRNETWRRDIEARLQALESSAPGPNPPSE